MLELNFASALRSAPTNASSASALRDAAPTSKLRESADFKARQRAVQPLQLFICGQQHRLPRRRCGEDDRVRQLDRARAPQCIHMARQFNIVEAQINHFHPAAKFTEQVAFGFCQPGEPGKFQRRDD